DSIAAWLVRAQAQPSRPPTRRRSGAVCGAPRAIAIEAVVGALGTQRARQRQRLAGLAVAPEQLHRAAQAEQGVVVRGRAVGDGVELRGGARVVARMKERPPERLADGRLLRLEVARAAER